MGPVRRIAVIACALAALALPASAQADYHEVIRDCAQDSKLDRRYKPRELKQALDNIPSDINEYTPCAEVIAAALRTGGGGSSSAPTRTSGGIQTSSGATAGSATDVAALRSAADSARGRPSVDLGGQTLRPVAGRLDGVAGAANELPTPLLLALAAVAVLCAVGGVVAARRRWRDIARGPLRLIRR